MSLDTGCDAVRGQHELHGLLGAGMPIVHELPFLRGAQADSNSSRRSTRSAAAVLDPLLLGQIFSVGVATYELAKAVQTT